MLSSPLNATRIPSMYQANDKQALSKSTTDTYKISTKNHAKIDPESSHFGLLTASQAQGQNNTHFWSIFESTWEDLGSPRQPTWGPCKPPLSNWYVFLLQVFLMSILEGCQDPLGTIVSSILEGFWKSKAMPTTTLKKIWKLRFRFSENQKTNVPRLPKNHQQLMQKRVPKRICKKSPKCVQHECKNRPKSVPRAAQDGPKERPKNVPEAWPI